MGFSNPRTILTKSIGFGSLIMIGLLIWLRQYPLDLPFEEGADVFLSFFIFKSLSIGEWLPLGIIKSNLIGAPHGTILADFPHADQLNFLFIKLISFFTDNPIVVFNCFYLLGFVFCGATCLTLCLLLGMSSAIAFSISSLFTFLPYHFYRYQHIFLSNYYLIPLQTIVLLIGFTTKDRKEGLQFTFAYFIVLAATGFSGIYYAFFFCFFLVVMGLVDSFSFKTFLPLKRSFSAVLVLVGFLLIASIPYISYFKKNERNFQVAQRSPIEAELYGLKLNNLVIPNDRHRSQLFRRVNSRYQSIIPQNESSKGGYLGLFSILGLFLLVFYFLDLNNLKMLPRKLLILAGSGFLLATVGGFGALFNFWVSPMIRCYNRISPFLALFGLINLGLFLTEKFSKMGKWLLFFLSFLIVTMGLWDQTPDLGDWLVKHKQARLAELKAHRTFVSSIERIMPPNGSVYTLPFMAFPENGPINKMNDYSFFRLIIWSEQLKWSYGAVKGRSGSIELEKLAAAPVNLSRIRMLGFQGICIDRFGYEDNAQEIESAFQNELKSPPVLSADGRYSFFLL